MKRMMLFTALLGLMVMVTLTLEGSSHKAGDLPETLAGLVNGLPPSPPNFASAGNMWDVHGDLLLSSEFHRFEGPDAIAGALHARYNGWHVELAGPSHTWPAEPGKEAALFEPKVLAIEKIQAPKPAKPKLPAPKKPPSTMAFALGINRPDLEFLNWVYRAQQGGTTRIELYTAIAQRRHVDPVTAPKDHEHTAQWRFLTVRELPAPSPLP